MRDARARAVFVLSAIVLAVLYGTEAGRSNWFPNPQVSLAMTTVRDVSRYWENDLGLKPTRHLVPARVQQNLPLSLPPQDGRFDHVCTFPAQLPQRRLHERCVALEPLAELAPDLELPGHGPVREILARVH